MGVHLQGSVPVSCQFSDFHFTISQQLSYFFFICIFSLPLSVATRMLNTHDVPCLLVQLVEDPPWRCHKDGNHHNLIFFLNFNLCSFSIFRLIVFPWWKLDTKISLLFQTIFCFKDRVFSSSLIWHFRQSIDSN